MEDGRTEANVSPGPKRHAVRRVATWKQSIYSHLLGEENEIR